MSINFPNNHQQASKQAWNHPAAADDIESAEESKWNIKTLESATKEEELNTKKKKKKKKIITPASPRGHVDLGPINLIVVNNLCTQTILTLCLSMFF